MGGEEGETDGRGERKKKIKINIEEEKQSCQLSNSLY
jgi:hypothetical protein